jgi:hypothetical protein
MGAGYSRFSTLGEDGRYCFDATSRRVLDGDTQVYTAKITVATFDETFLHERGNGPAPLAARGPGWSSSPGAATSAASTWIPTASGVRWST